MMGCASVGRWSSCRGGVEGGKRSGKRATRIDLVKVVEEVGWAQDGGAFQAHSSSRVWERSEAARNGGATLNYCTLFLLFVLPLFSSQLWPSRSGCFRISDPTCVCERERVSGSARGCVCMCACVRAVAIQEAVSATNFLFFFAQLTNER